jgi:MoaA/NifB/PqqE/SkfB family radical SAM enzyme
MNIKDIQKNPRYIFDRFLQEVELRTGIRCSKPSEVWIKLTERCNCRCQMCDIWKKNRFSDGELTTQDWKKILLGLRQWLGKRHIWFTGGEPFLRKDCIELIGYSSSIGLSIRVITNGILLRPDDIPFLVEGGLREYHVSIDSMDPQIHDHLRGIPGAHKRASENVLVLKEFLNKSGKKMKIVIKTIIMGYNAKEILPLVEWTEKFGFDEIKFQPLESDLEGGEDPQWFNRSPYWPKGKEVNELAVIMDKLIVKKESGGNIYNSIPELENMKEYFLEPAVRYEQVKNHTLLEETQRLQCRIALGWMEILSHGGLRICRHMPPQGDIRTTTPREFWKNRLGCWKNPAQFCFRGSKEG